MCTTVLCCVLHILLYLYVVYYVTHCTDGSASVYQQWTTKGQSVNFHQPLFSLGCLFNMTRSVYSYDVTERYNCSNDIHSDDVTCIFRHGRIQGHIYLTQCSILLRTLLRLRFHQCDSAWFIFPSYLAASPSLIIPVPHGQRRDLGVKPLC